MSRPASVAELRDLEYKIEKAMTMHGARYVHIHVTCPLGWGSEPKDSILVARLAVQTGLFPVFEAENGVITDRLRIKSPKPVEEYLRLQRRFAHLFKGGRQSGRARGHPGDCKQEYA